MKTGILKVIIRSAFSLVCLASLNAPAQMPGAGGPAGMSAALTKLFGNVTAFSAKATISVVDGSQQEIVNTPMNFALLDKKIRVAMDMTQAKNKDMPPNAAASLKQMGMAQVVSIIRPDKKLVYVLYPEQKMLLSMPLPPEEAAAAEKTPKLQQTPLGKETLDGHPCVKNKVVFSDDQGKSMEATTWNATDLKDFPILIQTKDKENTSSIRFKDIQLAKPDAKEFEPPSGYTQYTNSQEMMQGMMKKMMENSQSK